MRRPILSIVALVALVALVAMVACSSNDVDTPSEITRIDGPAVVDEDELDD